MNNAYDFPVKLERIYISDANDNRIEIPKRGAIVRTDTNDTISVTSDRYKILEHKSVVDTFDSIDSIQRERVNVCQGGAIMFADYKFNSGRTTTESIKVGDLVDFKLRVFNSYNMLMGVGFEVFAMRLVCTNGLMIPKSIGRLSYKHILGTEIFKMKAMVEETYANSREQLGEWRKWVDLKPSKEAVTGYFDLIKETLGERNHKRLLEEGIQGTTLWDVFNIMTRFTSHEINVRKADMKLVKQRDLEQDIIAKFYNYAWMN
jgi:hypothetical protein